MIPSWSRDGIARHASPLGKLEPDLRALLGPRCLACALCDASRFKQAVEARLAVDRSQLFQATPHRAGR
jgi:hypothetical protein